MSLLTKKQKIYLAIFNILLIIFFSFCAICLVGYATGYRINWKIKKVQIVGEIYLESLPKNANVYIDNKLQKNKTPCRISLLPGTYKIRVEKEGFYEWYGTAEIKPKLVTELQHIILFPKEKPSVLTKEKISDFITDNNQIIFSNNQKIFLKKDSQKTILFPQQKNKIFNQYSNLQFLGKNKLFFTAFENKKVTNFLIDLNSNVAQQFNFNLSPTKVALNPQKTEEIFILANQSLYKYKFNNPDKKIILNNRISDFEIINNKIYYLKENTLWSENLLGENNVLLAELPLNDIYKIFPWSNRILILGSKGNLFMFENNKIRLIDINVTELEKTKQKLLYTNGNEIWIFSLFEQEKTLVTRLSKKISNPHWLDEHHILFVANKKLHVLEITGKNDTVLTSFKNLTKLIIDREKKIYYLDENKLYSLKVMPQKSLFDIF